MTSSMPPRRPEETAAAFGALLVQGACCGHTRSVHAPDGCRVCQLQPRSTTPLCTGWREPGAQPEPPPAEDPVLQQCRDLARALVSRWRFNQGYSRKQADVYADQVVQVLTGETVQGTPVPDDGVVDAEVLETWAWLEQQHPDRLVPLAAVRAAYEAGHEQGAGYQDGESYGNETSDYYGWAAEHGYYPATGELS